MNGNYGETIATLLLSRETPEGRIFDCLRIGGNWPTIDVYSELLNNQGNKIFCFFQIKGTELPLANGRLQTGMNLLDINRLSHFHAPTYFIGVQHNIENPPLSQGYLKTIRGDYEHGFGRLSLDFPLSPENLILLRNELWDYWANVDVLNHKEQYHSIFEI